MLTKEQTSAIDAMTAQFRAKQKRAQNGADGAPTPTPAKSAPKKSAPPNSTLGASDAEQLEEAVAQAVRAAAEAVEAAADPGSEPVLELTPDQTTDLDQEPAPEPVPVLAPESTPEPELSVPPSAYHERSEAEAREDESWARANLRWSGANAFADMANVLRVMGRHPAFYGRFLFDKSTGEIHDRGAVMLGWQVDELCAEIQERFIPEVSQEIVFKALVIAANRNSAD